MLNKIAPTFQINLELIASRSTCSPSECPLDIRLHLFLKDHRGRSYTIEMRRLSDPADNLRPVFYGKIVRLRQHSSAHWDISNVHPATVIPLCKFRLPQCTNTKFIHKYKPSNSENHTSNFDIEDRWTHKRLFNTKTGMSGADLINNKCINEIFSEERFG